MNNSARRIRVDLAADPAPFLTQDDRNRTGVLFLGVVSRGRVTGALARLQGDARINPGNALPWDETFALVRLGRWIGLDRFKTRAAIRNAVDWMEYGAGCD